MRENPKIRVVHLQLLPLMSGVQKVSLDEMALISREKFEPILVCKMPGDFTEAVERLGVSCHFIDSMERAISPLSDAKAMIKLYKLFRKIRPDVVHTHSSKTGVLGRIAAKFARVPVVIHTVHGFPFDSAANAKQRRLYVALEWMSARFCDAMVMLKNADLELSHEKLFVPRRKLHLIPNGVALKSFEAISHTLREAKRSVLPGCLPDDVCIAMTGRLWDQKNPECFVDAAIEVLNTGIRNSRFYLIGDGPLREALQEKIDLSGHSQRITILGWRDDVPLLLQLIDIFVLPSRWEGLSLAILEAMASGLPVIASNIPGNTDLVEEGKTGYQFLSEDADSLAEKMLILIADSDKRKAMGAAGRKVVDQKYRIERRVKVMEQLYSKMLFKPAGGFADIDTDFRHASIAKQTERNDAKDAGSLQHSADLPGDICTVNVAKMDA